MFKKNTAITGFVVGMVSATDGSDITTTSPVGYYTLDGGTQTPIGDTTGVHEGNGMWSFDLLAAEMNGDVVGLTFTHASAITAHFTIKTDTKITSELNDVAATDIVSAGAITTLAGAVSTVTNLTNLPSIPANWLTAAGIAASAMNGKGDWNVGKTGYALTQAFPTNFADLAISVTTGKITVGTNDDKTAYSLTQAFPANFSDLAIVITTGLVSGDWNTVAPDNSGISDIQSRLPAALVAGRMDSDVAVIQANAITASALATDAVDEIRDAILPTQNVAFNNIAVLFVAASDHVTPVTGATGAAVTRSIDGGAFGAATGTFAEIANGVYQFDASAADMNGGSITFRFVATGGTPGAPDDVFLTVITGGGV